MVLTVGTYKSDTINGGLAVEWNKKYVEVCLIVDGNIVSAYRHMQDNSQFCYGSTKSKDVYDKLMMGWRGCNSKNGAPVPFAKGTAVRHNFTNRSGVQYRVDRFNSEELAGIEAHDSKNNVHLYTEYSATDWSIPKDIPYISLTVEQELGGGVDPADAIQTRSLAEISLEKDITWLNDRKYFIVNDPDQAEQLFTALEQYKGVIAYDTETTGLRINMFGKVNSRWEKELAAYNAEHKDAEIRADKLVGIIFSCEPGTSYYIPCANRKFDNLYGDTKDARVRRVAEKYKAYYTVGEGGKLTHDIARYFRDTSIDDMRADVLVMERCRWLLEHGKFTGHNVAFDWKVSWLYEINVNFTDDTMLMHQLMYKFRSTTSNRGEPSDLKSLTKREFGIDQLSLTDFFVGGVEDDRKEVKSVAGKGRNSKKKKTAYIDFSYMTYDGARAYGPADGDFSIALFLKYKTDLINNHRELEYLYTVEVIVAKAVGYMEFYGHRIDESKIEETRKKYEHEKEELGKEMLKMAGLKEEDEFNLGSPAQMAWLFYDKMGIPVDGDKKSVAKASLKPLMALKNEDGSLKYPIIKAYSDWKKIDTLLTKFFDNLQNFMYPGGYIFSHFGQISTATGRMSCSGPNCQQYPKAVTKLVCPRDNYIMIDADYSQIEYRTLVALAHEENLMKTFEDPDSDYHTLMASRMFGVPYASVTPAMRSDAKAFNFGIPYGMGFRSLAIRLTGMAGDAQVEEAKQKYELYFKDQPRVRKFFSDVKEAALINKYTQTHFGRRRYYSFVGKDGKEDNRRKGAALRQAGNAVIQGTAADIYKISVARMFTWISQAGLLGQVLIVNMIHDEQLLEVNCDTLNIQVVLKNVLEKMQFSVEGFPPLFVGAGVGTSWATAKDKMGEIHPELGDELVMEVSGDNETSIYVDKPVPKDEWLKYFNKRIYEFEKARIVAYLTDSKNYGSDLHPAVGNTLNLRFVPKEIKDRLAANPAYYKGHEDDETKDILAAFIRDNGLDVDPNAFSTKYTVGKSVEPEEDDKEYSDEDDDDEDSDDEYIRDGDFALIDEDESLYGISMQDLIKTFGLVVSKEQAICGIDIEIIPLFKREELYDYLTEHACEPDEPGAMRVTFLKAGNVLYKTEVYVKDIDGSAMSAKLQLNTIINR